MSLLAAGRVSHPPQAIITASVSQLLGGVKEMGKEAHGEAKQRDPCGGAHQKIDRNCPEQKQKARPSDGSAPEDPRRNHH